MSVALIVCRERFCRERGWMPLRNARPSNKVLGMLYHDFGNKEHLFREVLRLKMSQRQALAEAVWAHPAKALPFRLSRLQHSMVCL